MITTKQLSVARVSASEIESSLATGPSRIVMMPACREVIEERNRNSRPGAGTELKMIVPMPGQNLTRKY